MWRCHGKHHGPHHAVVQSLSYVWLFPIPWTAACQAFLSITISWSLLKLMSIELVMLSNHLILCHPLLFLPPVFPRIKVLFNELALHIRWPKYWCFSIILPVNIQGLFLLGMTGLIFLQLKRLSRVFSSTTSLKALIPQCSAFFMVQLSHPYMTTGKTIALSIETFDGKVMSLLFNMLSRFVMAFRPRSKRLLISWP